MSPLWWFYLMLVFWLSWLVSSMSIFFWFKLSGLMTSSLPLFFFFFFYFGDWDYSLIVNLNNKISLIDLVWFYSYDF
uniref:ATP synthase F0 subunit 8 n=1 Tax=Bemisia tabaci TaxID=7038 RepID=A0A678NVE3_BEMTA|nr:ATP synthase F0 subunit 8 [Bemisia tabaci]